MTERAYLVDPELKKYATPAQARYIDAANEHGSYRAAERALGLSSNGVRKAVEAVKAKAAKDGYAPGHFIAGVAAGYKMGKVTVHRNAAGELIQTWERQHPDDKIRLEIIQAAFAEACKELPRLKPIKAPAVTSTSLCNLVTFTDYHMGMLAKKAITGADWNCEIAEAMLVAAQEHLLSNAPKAETLVINLQGDFFHWDGHQAVTPTHGHILEADGNYSYMVEAGIRVIRRIIDIALRTHRRVKLLFVEGNHDLVSTGVWLRKMFAALYEKEPRLEVIQSEVPYYAYRHGKVMLSFHHGHLKKNESLPELFAAMYAEMWGQTTYRYCHTGHYHHEESKEHSGMKVIRHPTLAAPDNHAIRNGYLSQRAANLITYHGEYGQVASNTVTPEMLALAA